MSEPDDADAHYHDARYYDHAYSRYKPDLAFYVALAKERGGGPVLELGVGTGRVALAIAKEGVEVVGVDRMPTMLARFAERLAKAPKRVRERITVHEGDLRDLPALGLERRFPLVIAPFNVLQHVYSREDLERTLAGVRALLLDRGALALDVLMPDPASLARDPRRFFRCRPVTHPRDGRKYDYEESFQYDHELQIQTTTMRFTDREDRKSRFTDRLPQRQYFPRELEALLHYNGFRVIRQDGGFDEEPIDAWTESMVVIAERR